MRSPGNSRLILAGAALAGLLFALTLSACDEDDPIVAKDIGVDVFKADIKADIKKVPDTGPDQIVWPDLPVPDAKTDTGGYKPSPFGCHSDRDCFGQRCCPTPWGVKLCSADCALKP